MTWPPQSGEPLPDADRAYGVREKLGRYSLRLDHPDRGRKAEGFARVLAITADDLEYLTEALLGGLRTTAVSRVRPAGEYGSTARSSCRFEGFAMHRSDRERPDGLADPVGG